jgi:2-methylcitrate dehydratase PrpD
VTTGLAGKFSMSYCAAVALLRGRVAEEDFLDAAVGDPVVQALAARVALQPSPRLDETRARVAVQVADGGRHELLADLRAAGDGERLQHDLVGKFRRLVAPRLGAAEAERLAAAILRLEAVGDLRELHPGPAHAG